MQPYTIRDKFADIIEKLLVKSGKKGGHDTFHGIKFYVSNHETEEDISKKKYEFASVKFDGIEVTFYNGSSGSGKVELDLIRLNQFNLSRYLNEVDKRIEKGKSYKPSPDAYYSEKVTDDSVSKIIQSTDSGKYLEGFDHGIELGQAKGYKEAVQELLGKPELTVKNLSTAYSTN